MVTSGVKILNIFLISTKKSILWNAISGHLDRFSRPSIENNFVLEFVSYFITTKKLQKLLLYCQKDLLLSTLKLWFERQISK